MTFLPRQSRRFSAGNMDRKYPDSAQPRGNLDRIDQTEIGQVTNVSTDRGRCCAGTVLGSTDQDWCEKGQINDWIVPGLLYCPFGVSFLKVTATIFDIAEPLG